MNILHLIDSFDARFERDQIKLVELLEGKGHRNTVITSRYSSDRRLTDKAKFKQWEKRFQYTKIIHSPSFRIPTPFSIDPSKSVYLPSKEILQDFDIIHAYSFATYSSLLGSMLKTAKRFKFVVRSDLSPKAFHKARNSPLYRTILMFPFRSAEAVYAYSSLEKRCLIDLGVQENKIWVIPVGIDIRRFSENPKAKEETVIIGFLGRFVAVKGIHRIIPALCQILEEEKGVAAVFTGILEDEEYAKNVMNSFKRFSNFMYLSNLSMSPTRFYNMCDIVLVPSVLETGAITVLEAMAAGRVVIASDINPINEYIQHGKTGFLFRDPKEMYLYLKKLIENPDLIRETGERARKEATKYDWQLVVSKYEKMYESIVDKN